MTQTVTPYVFYEDAEAALEFLARAFGFREVKRSTGVAGGMHAEMEVHLDGSRIMLGQPPGDFRGPGRIGQTSMIYVLVEDVDRHHDRARAEGARIIEELTDFAYGHRRYGAEDPQGHQWTFAMPITERQTL